MTSGTLSARQRRVRTLVRRLGALVLAVLLAFTIAAAPFACSGPSDGPKPSGGVPSY